MNVDLQIVKALLNKEAYNKYSSFVKLDDSLKKHIELICSMQESSEGNISLDEFIARAEQQHLVYMEEIKQTEVGEATLSELIRIHSERSFCYSLGLVCMEAFEGRKQLSDVLEEYSKIEALQNVNEMDKSIVTDDIEELLNSTSREGGIRWRLPFLNDNIGGLRGGDFGFIFARTNTGKTTFVASEVSQFLTQVDRPVLWCNNEEGGNRIKVRVIQSLLGINRFTLDKHPAKAMDAFLERSRGNFVLYDSKGGMHKRDVENYAKKFNPQIIIIDNIDKVHGFKGDRRDVMLGQAYTWARELAKATDCAIIGVSQASSMGENKRWLDHKDIAEAHTAKSSEADFIIGIGMKNDVGMEDIRFLRIVKNKFKHGEQRIETEIDTNICRYKEL